MMFFGVFKKLEKNSSNKLLTFRQLDEVELAAICANLSDYNVVTAQAAPDFVQYLYCHFDCCITIHMLAMYVGDWL